MTGERLPGERRNFLPGGNDAFACAHCGAGVLPLVQGSTRNHCPRCLWSRHADRVPGDRQAACGGLMEPVAIRGSSASGWTLVHRCVECGFERANRAATDDPRQPDEWERLLELSRAGG